MLHMKEDATIDTFTRKLTTIVNKAASLGHTTEDSVVVQKLLNAVPDKFLQIVASIEQYSDLDEMSVDEAIERLKTFEERFKSKKEIPVNSQESLMFTRHEGQGKSFRERGLRRFNQSQGREQDKNNYQSKREERASFEEDTRDKSQVTWSAEIAESAETAGSVETTVSPDHAFGELIVSSGIIDDILDSLMALKDLDDVPGLSALSTVEDMHNEKKTRKSTRADIERQKQEEIANARVRQVDSQGRAYGIGKRKCSIARVWIEPGEGKFLINDNQFDVNFSIHL
nr:28S ribosomal protein S9, mitochondrial [Tanacetum cinerariifolium]